MSTNASQKMMRTNFMEAVPVTDADGEVTLMRSVFDPRVQSLLRSVTRARPELFRGDMPFTTFVYREYGNTSIYWLVLTYNGYVHPLEVVPGSIIELPFLPDIDRYIARLNSVDRRGEKVTI